MNKFGEIVPANKDKPEHPVITGARVAGKTLAGLSIGTLSGLGAARLADYLMESKSVGPGDSPAAKYIVPALGILGGLGGLAHVYLHEKQLREMRDALEKYRNKPTGSK